MNFGDKLKQLRKDRNLTQPELAGAIGIEQSYLSKLENNKSLPSNDILNQILDVFGLEIGALLIDLNQSTRNKLRQIPDVAAHLNHQKRQLIGNRRRWLFGSAILISLGVALIYAGNVHLFFSDVVYQYVSMGVVLEGESKEIIPQPGTIQSKSATKQDIDDSYESIWSRIDQDYILRSEFYGDIYNVKVEGGSRTYYLKSKNNIDPWQSKLVVFIGVIVTMLGLTGILLDRKLSNPYL